MENSLRVLQTSYFDLYQFHAVTTSDDVDKILAAGGALEAVKKARSQGKVRAIGFSAHDEAAALRLIRSEEFDSVMFPLNFYSHSVGVRFAVALAGPQSRPPAASAIFLRPCACRTVIYISRTVGCRARGSG
jgi:predicted aldo/keto reductase-like oxidoreductase